MKNQKQESQKVVAFCGLYCSNCSKYTSNKCPGCILNSKATWCKIRLCCVEKGITTCAECLDYSFVKQCGKYNNIFSKVIEFISQTDRSRSIELIKLSGKEALILKMEELGKMSLRKEKK